ncbi:hypothetical protein [Treponema bryantii]|uniref:hypothetical protein n=1 Tax=Treponema bryantii TaxID=163 RepID=UPI000943CF45|nr:hypothetical protein [Treponema bryantii]
MSKVLCKSCEKWVDCTKDDNLPIGFCLVEPLFTYTERTLCGDYEQGKPFTEEEWEMCNE